MAKPKSCTLVCLQRSHNPIALPDGIPVIIGRSPLTRITDPRCSRNQVELTSSWSDRVVKVRQIASNNTSIDGSDIGHSKEATLRKNSTLFILSGQYPHQVVFEDDISSTTITPKYVCNIEAGKTKETKIQNSSAKGSSGTPETNNNKDENNKKAKKRPNTDEDQHQDIKKRKSMEKEKVKNRNEIKSDTSDHKSVSKSSISPKSSLNSASKTSHRKNSQDISDEEAEHLKQVKAKLQKMKQIAMHETSQTSSPNGTANSLSSSTKAKSSASLVDSSLTKSSKTNSSSSLKKSSEAKTGASWTSHEHLLVYTSKDVEHRNRIAGFDIDGTIIVTKSGKTFPTDSSDWKIAFPVIFGKLKVLHKEGYKIVFFTNQLGVARGKVKIDDLKTKIENIISHLHVPVQVFVATHSGKYRKPMDGMWRRLKSQYNGGISIETSSSIYVGDAAGRPADWEPKKKKDFSCSDRLFALNVGVKFYTPEEYFMKHKQAKFNMPSFDPRALPAKGDWIPKDTKLTLDTKEIILLVGYPASGKSHFAKNVLKPKGYVIVNRDTLGSWQKCVKITQETIVNSSVVVDNTNLTQDERLRYIKCAKQEGAPCRCFVFTTSIDHCRHNERFREITDKSHAVINEMLFNKIKSSYKEPDMSEGFTEIVKVSFVPKFSSSSLEADYRKFLLEK